MKLTPLDIHHKEFRRSVRGYSEVEVDGFLDEVADEFERLFKENIDLSERLEAAEEKVRSYVEMEKTLHNTMVAAQRSAEDIVDKARAEAETILRDAEVKAKEIIHNALTQKQRVQGELLRIKQAEEEFRGRFGGLLDSYRQSLAEIELPADVEVMFGETAEGVVGDVAVAPESAFAAAEEAETLPDEVPAEEAISGEVEAAETTEETHPDAVPEEPPTSGFVTSVQLGELEDTDLEAEEPVYGEPAVYDLPPVEVVGERDPDVDIEEID